MSPTDRAILRPSCRPQSAADLTPRWLHDVRTTVVRDGHNLRPGFPACIEVLGPVKWQPLNLPSNGIEFVSTDERDHVLAMLTGDAPLPELEAK